MDEMVSDGAEIVLQAATRTEDPAVLAEALEIVRMQGLPTRVEAAGATAPLGC